MTFDEAFDNLYKNEGGFTVDNGGPTKYGISQNSYPNEDIKNLTLERAKLLYKRDFWGPAGCDLVPDLIRFELFDTAVNTSAPGNPVTARRLLQRAAGLSNAAQDGVLGPLSLQAVNAMAPWRLLVRFIGVRLSYYTHVKPGLWDEAGKGWVNRVSNNCLRM